MMQMIDLKHLFIAQTFSNPSRVAPGLGCGSVGGRLSTKLSTGMVDDRFGFRRSCELLPACHKFVVEASPDAAP